MSKIVILCVDDEQIVLNSLKTELSQAFSSATHIVEVAESGQEALEVIEFHLKRQNQVAVIVSDYIMPEMKGDELLIRIHQTYPSIIKILLTGQVSLEGVSNAINNASLFRYISKPWESNDLIMTVATAIQSFLSEQLLISQNLELKRFNKELEAKVAERTHELRLRNEHIEASIRYALRIQNAILPDDEVIKSQLKDFFILYKPRDVVSGDFFWFAHTLEKTLVVVSDCTGHGVPGAFMSLIGESLLDRIVYDSLIMSPDLILLELNKGLAALWRYDTSGLSDGMETSILLIDKTTQKLEFAGAKSPLFYIRNGEDVFQDGTRRAIDGKLENTYTKVELDMLPNTRYFMYSDGYQDQAGGTEQRRLQSKNFRKLLLESTDKSLKEQKTHLEQRFDEWRGKMRQVDDILIWGFEII